MKEFYRHYRVIHDLDDGILPHGGVTAHVWANDDVAGVTFAVCSMKDNYCKRVGRAIAVGRHTYGGKITIRFATPGEFEVRLLDAALWEFWNANRNHMGHWLRRSPARKKARREETGDGARE